MFRPEVDLGPRSSIAPGSDSEAAALALVRQRRNHEAQARGVNVDSYHLGEIAGKGAILRDPTDIYEVAHIQGEMNRLDRPAEGAIDLPPVQDPELLELPQASHEDRV